MGRFDTAFSLAALVLIGVSVVCLCKTAEYRSQAKFATERYEEMKDSLTKAEREAERKLRETDAEWKAKIWKTEREAELAEKEQNRKHRLEIEKTRTEHAAEIAGRDEQIRALEERIVKLSNDAVRVIAQYHAQNRARYAVPQHTGTQAVRTGSAGKVVDRSCDACDGRGKVSRKETCGVRGTGLFAVHDGQMPRMQRQRLGAEIHRLRAVQRCRARSVEEMIPAEKNGCFPAAKKQNRGII